MAQSLTSVHSWTLFSTLIIVCSSLIITDVLAIPQRLLQRRWFPIWNNDLDSVTRARLMINDKNKIIQSRLAPSLPAISSPPLSPELPPPPPPPPSAASLPVFSVEAKNKEFICPATFGYFKNENECKAFFRCIHGKYIRYACPNGLRWNQRILSCDWPSRVKCQKKNDYCWGKKDGTYMNRKSCKKFYTCDSGKALHMQCIPGFLYDVVEGTCRAASKVHCAPWREFIEYAPNFRNTGLIF